MDIKLDDLLMKKIGIDAQEALELLAVAIYKYKGVHGSLAGKLIGKSEFDFHTILAQKGENMNYDIGDLVDDIKNNEL